VIGDPIAQSKSPAIHTFWLGKLGIDAEYRAAHVRDQELADYLRERREDPDWRGCNVTMPHKQSVLPYLERLDALAGRIGAVNTIVRSENGSLAGFNTDAVGFLEPLRPLLAREHLFRMARVIGTGGAARAIVAALARENVVIVLAGRDPAKARALHPPHLGIGIEHRHAAIREHARHGRLAHPDRAGQAQDEGPAHAISSARSSRSPSSRAGGWPKNFSNAAAAWPISIDRPSMVGKPAARAAWSNGVSAGCVTTS
jgi:shikimate dehydrogenase